MTTHAKHTTKTTPTTPSWRFTNEPSLLGEHTMKKPIIGGIAAALAALGIAGAFDSPEQAMAFAGQLVAA